MALSKVTHQQYLLQAPRTQGKEEQRPNSHAALDGDQRHSAEST